MSSDGSGEVIETPIDPEKEHTRIFFRIVKQRPGHQRVQQLAHGAGQRLEQHHMVISLASAETYLEEDLSAAAVWGSRHTVDVGLVISWAGCRLVA